MITRSWSRQLFARKPRTNRAAPARLRPRSRRWKTALC